MAICLPVGGCRIVGCVEYECVRYCRQQPLVVHCSQSLSEAFVPGCVPQGQARKTLRKHDDRTCGPLKDGGTIGVQVTVGWRYK